MRTVARWLAWWLLLFGLWLTYAGVLAWTESAVGVLAAAVAATAAEVVRAQGLMQVRVEGRWAVRALGVPLRLLRELGLVLIALTHGRPHGRLKTVHFSPQGPVATHAFPAWADTITPNDYVLEVEGGDAVKHVLVETDASGEVL